jgi:hypothetical protein
MRSSTRTHSFGGGSAVLSPSAAKSVLGSKSKALGRLLGPQGVTMKTTCLDRTYIDYFNIVHHFGIRVLEDRCLVVIQMEDAQPILGQPTQIPVQFETVPSHVRMIVDYLMNNPTSDLMDVLTGKISFQEALRFASDN